MQTPVTDVGAKISVIEASEKYLFVGTMNGEVHRIPFDPNKATVNPQDPRRRAIQIGKNKVENIKYVPIVCCVLVQTADGLLFQIDEEIFSKAGDPLFKSCYSYCLNEYPKKIPELLVFSSSKPKNQLIHFKFNNQSGRFEEDDADVQKLPDAPAALAWFDRTIFVAFKGRSYDRINLVEKTIAPIYQEQVPQRPLIKVISEEEILILMNPDTGMSHNIKTFEPLPKSTIHISNKFVGITVVHPYIIILYDNMIQVFNVNVSRNKGRLLQEITLSKDTGKGLASANNKVFFATTQNIYLLSLVPYKDQIFKCLMSGKVDDAQLIFDQYVSEDDPERAKKTEMFKVEASWVLIRDLNFKNARNMIADTNFDLKELLALFREYLPTTKDVVNNINIANKRNITMSLVIDEAIKSGRAPQEFRQDPSKVKKIAKEFLAFVLENRRAYYLANYDESHFHEVPKFTTTGFSLLADEVKKGLMIEHSIQNLLEMIDFALIRLYAEFKEEVKLSLFLDNPKIYCKAYLTDLEPYVLDLKNLNPSIVAKFYEQFGKLREALEIWRDLGNSVKFEVSEQAAEQTIRILKNCKDSKLILEYLKWVLIKTPKIAMRVFSVLDEKVVHPDKMIEYLEQNISNPANARMLKEKFLEVQVLDNKIEDEKYHTILAKYYVQQLFEMRPRDYKDEQYDKKFQGDKKMESLMKKFHDFLRDPKAKYRSDTILQEIKDSWLFDDEIYLYGKEKQHQKALKKLLENHHFIYAEEYCSSKNEGLLTELFKLYIRLYLDTEAEMKNKPSKECDQILQTLKILINTFLKKYASHPQLDPLAVVELIPEDWLISGDEENNGVYIFLTASLSSRLHKRRNTKIAKSLCEMDQLNVECTVAKAQQANVKITQDRNCSVCGKKIGEKVFVVYPNGVTTHHTCRADNDLHICPVTKQNFQKSFQS